MPPRWVGTPATKAKMAQRIVRSAHEGIRDAQQLVAAAVAEGMVPASSSGGLQSHRNGVSSPSLSANEMPDRPDVVHCSQEVPRAFGMDWLNSSGTRWVR